MSTSLNYSKKSILKGWGCKPINNFLFLWEVSANQFVWANALLVSMPTQHSLFLRLTSRPHLIVLPVLSDYLMNQTQ